MECVAKHDFNATQADELSFPKGAVLKVLNKDDDQNWFKAEWNGVEGYIPRNYIVMEPHLWYYGGMKRQEAEDTLLGRKNNGNYIQPDGAFLVRPSETSPEGFSISVKCGNFVQHFKVLRDKANGRYYVWVVRFSSINELIMYHRNTTISRTQAVFLRDMVPVSVAPSRPNGAQNMVERVRALYDFEAHDSEELAFSRGDTISVLDRSDPNWWKGELHGRLGLFPATYVSPL